MTEIEWCAPTYCHRAPQVSTLLMGTLLTEVPTMHSSLHTIRPMETAGLPSGSPTERVSPRKQQHRLLHPELHFPFRENTIARRAQAPGQTELSYQYADEEENDSVLADLPLERHAVQPTDTESEAEAKRHRSARLAARLQEVFGLKEEEEVLEEMTCWLLRSVSEYG